MDNVSGHISFYEESSSGGQDNGAALEFRRLTVEDVPTFIEMRIHQLLEEGARETVDLRPALRDYYERHVVDNTFISWIALDGERIVATSGISIVEKPPYFGCPTGRLGLISSMYTDPAYRRKGIAKHLLSRIVEEARIRKCGAVHITASDAGVPLYRSLGFSHNGHFLQLVL